ncbi:hypothetical protein CBM2626_B60053 [Cupriavidus taiwanensis]|uniref:DUF1484 family protein n=1 Tax=Cupriavidus taiwanensis TaxID=164546 RepID=UPI000E17F283|nr:DUF1484 family protein [Cupriavidus taiwanensis]SPA03056.1 hypothetical protein CBM2626_B60053 [Cupriavidus taiwanensis]
MPRVREWSVAKPTAARFSSLRTDRRTVGLHALLSPLKEQLDESVSRLQALV